MSHLKVAVRVRPLSQQEIAAKPEKIVKVHNSTTISVLNTKVPTHNAGDSRERVRLFSFDYCYDEISTQEEIFSMVGEEVGNALKNKFHSSVLAYGQSSTGKTHTMTGNSNDPGLIPRLCKNVFEYVNEESEFRSSFQQTVVSYLEIYNEKVQDLLAEEGNNRPLKVREHPKKGPYVQGLSEHNVQQAQDLLVLFKNGNSRRRVAATPNNTKSSRSHSLFTITCTGGIKLHLVDLAGSERAGSRCHSTCSFKEGANINKSLVALGNVISVLAEHTGKTYKQNRKRFVPYRDSVLTWLLKDTLGGNSKTVMIATVSPSHLCYNETINTLRFGQRAKQIITQPIVNEDIQEKTIRELRAEIARLRQLLADVQLPKQALKVDVDLSPSNLSITENRTLTESSNSTTEENVTTASNDTKEILPTVTFKQQTDVLLPVIDVVASVNKVKVSNPKIRSKIASVRPRKMEDKKKNSFGSEETLAGSSNGGGGGGGAKSDKSNRKSVPVSRKSSVDSQDSLTGNAKAAELKKLLADSRKHSTDKVYVRTLLRKASEMGLTKGERGSLSDVRSPPGSSKDSKLDPQKKQRSDIVAAVTSRLYAKGKKKEVALGDNAEEAPAPEVPVAETPMERKLPELQLCNNARLRLRELSKLALKAQKRYANKEIQTEAPPVLRIKEQCTDVLDLPIFAQEAKDVSVGPEIETREIGIGCESNLIPSDFEPYPAFTLTRTCGTQISQDDKNGGTCSTAKYTPISFTKYLQARHQPKFEIIDHATANPIYTASVNINVSHNYITRGKTDGAVSDDSLENSVNQPSSSSPATNNVCSSTPDLISNHNSLEHANAAASMAAQKNTDQPVASTSRPSSIPNIGNF